MPGRRKTSKLHSHPSIQALLALANGESSPEQIVRTRCREMVAWAKRQGWDGPPYSPFQLASLNGIRTKEVQHDIGAEARIFCDFAADGLAKIEYRTDIVSDRRLRFTVFHELAHTVFPDCYSNPRYANAIGDQSIAEKEFEKLCDIGASELMFPREDLRQRMSQMDSGFDGIRRVSDEFIASIEATTVQCLQETDERMAAVFFKETKRKRDGAPLARVLQCWRSRSFADYVGPKFNPPRKSVVYKALALEPNQSTPIEQDVWKLSNRWLKGRYQGVRLSPVPSVRESPDIMVLIVE